MGKRKLSPIFTLAAMIAVSSLSAPAMAQQKEQYIPILSNRVGSYAPTGTPVANGMVDYYKLVNARGGINGVKLLIEECETTYDTARTVECYERLKGKNGGAAVIQPWATGATFSITEKAPSDKIPLITAGYGRSESADGMVFKWNFPIAGNYLVGADVLVQAIGKDAGGLDKLKGKKIAFIYLDSPYGKEPLPLLHERATMHGFQLAELPVTAPGAEQRATWLQVRQTRPDYIILWGYGLMNSTALKEAEATGFPRDKMYGSWWSGSEPDLRDVGEGAKGYKSVAFQNSTHYDAKVVKEILSTLHAKGQGTGPKEEVGQVMYLRGVLSSLLAVEGIRVAQERFGKGKVMNGEQVRWGLENLNLTQTKLDALGFAGVLGPINTTCQDHMGVSSTRMQTWDGKVWKISSDWIKADEQIMKPIVKAQATKYAADKKITPRTGADCQL